MLRIASFEQTLTQWQEKIADELSTLSDRVSEEENRDKPSESTLEKLNERFRTSKRFRKTSKLSWILSRSLLPPKGGTKMHEERMSRLLTPGEIIDDDCTIRTSDLSMIPAKNSIGRKLHPCEYGFVYTTRKPKEPKEPVS